MMVRAVRWLVHLLVAAGRQLAHCTGLEFHQIVRDRLGDGVQRQVVEVPSKRIFQLHRGIVQAYQEEGKGNADGDGGPPAANGHRVTGVDRPVGANSWQ